MQTEGLKPCPFCGSSDIRLRHHQAEKMSWVSCVGCGLEAPSETGVSEPDAVAYWNRRAEAALSSAEPEMNNAGSKCESLERSCTIDPDNDPKKENVYPAPPAPSVAVKALEALPGITGFGASFNRDKDAWVLYTTPSCDRFGQIDGFNPKVIDWILEALRSALSAQVQDVATHRHKKRGSEYVLIGVGKMQVENWCEFTTEVNHAEGREYAFAGKAVDMREVAIYRSVDDGSLWVRPVEEFNDGRFEPLPTAPAKQEG